MTHAKVILPRDDDVEVDMAKGEGRLSRWSRLKQKGGADEREQRDVEESRDIEKTAVAEAEPEAFKLPGGVLVRHVVPAMAPLAPDPEEGDDRLTRGIGHAEEDGGEPDVEALKNGPDDNDADGEDPPDLALGSEDDLFDGIEDEELDEEQQELVATLPPLDSLNGDSDFTPFMREGVPEFIKRKAMRILWRANPLFGFRDGLNDYDEDFNIVHKIIDESVGAYQVGRGHLTEEELQKMMPERAKKAFDEDEDDEHASDEEVKDVAEDPHAQTDTEHSEETDTEPLESEEKAEVAEDPAKTPENDDQVEDDPSGTVH